MNPSNRGRILVVDDNQEILLVVEKILACEGYAVTKAASGQAALDAATAAPPDLVILDLMLPDLDGLEVCRRVRENPETAGCMIILLTARGSPEAKVRGYDAGADDYVEKPFHREEFLARIRSALRLKSLLRQLEERNERLIESQEALVRRERMATVGLLAAGLAHEFNNIMSGIAGYAQLAKKTPDFLPKLIEVVVTQGKRAQEIIDSLRTFIRPQRITFVPVILGELVDAVVVLVAKEVERASLRLSVSIPANLPPVRAVPGQLQQILLNLVLNAIHATRPGGTIELGAEARAGTVELRVSDTGCGIPPEDLPRIFDPFFTTKGSLGGGQVPGTGLGLTVVYNLVRAHGANIAVESTVGRGTTFTVTIPQAHGGLPQETSERSRIILVTDDPVQESQVRQVVESDQLSVARSYEEAQQAIPGGGFTLALVDGDLGGGDPVAFLAWLRQAGPGIFSVVFSARIKESGFGHLADRHLLKPFAPEVLNDILLAERTGLPAVGSGAFRTLW